MSGFLTYSTVILLTLVSVFTIAQAMAMEHSRPLTCLMEPEGASLRSRSRIVPPGDALTMAPDTMHTVTDSAGAGSSWACAYATPANEPGRLAIGVRIGESPDGRVFMRGRCRARIGVRESAGAVLAPGQWFSFPAPAGRQVTREAVYFPRPGENLRDDATATRICDAIAAAQAGLGAQRFARGEVTSAKLNDRPE